MHTIHIPFIVSVLWMQFKGIIPKVHPLLIKWNAYARFDGWLEMKNKSRKLTLLYIVIILSTLGTFLPPIITWILNLCGKNAPPFEILGSTEWVSMISLVVSTYFGSNVWEKHVAISNGIMPSQLDNTCMVIKGSPGGAPIIQQQPQQVQVVVNQRQQQSDDDAERQQLKEEAKRGNQ